MIEKTQASAYRKSIILVFLAVGVLIFLYAAFRFTANYNDYLSSQVSKMERDLKIKENEKTELKNELQNSNSKGFIEREARNIDFIMPNEEVYIINSSDDGSKTP